MNAALRAKEQEAWCPRRDEAYIGVMVDDLITNGTSEPYRMFTSRAEYRLILREDNADLRLTEKGRELGLVDDERWSVFSAKKEGMQKETERLATSYVQPKSEQASSIEDKLSRPLAREYSLVELLRRPELTYDDVAGLVGEPESNPQVREQVEIQTKYQGYIDRQTEEIDRLRRYENTKLPENIDYDAIEGLSSEIKQKLNDNRPETLGRASRIQGMTPAAVSLLLVHLKKRSMVA